MLSDLYSDILLSAAASLPPSKRLKKPDASARRMSRVCGSVLEIDIAVDNGVIGDYGLDVKACALGQAAAGLVAESLIGAKTDSLQKLRDDAHAMLKANGVWPNGDRWAKIGALAVIRDYPNRHASTLLIFDALADCAEAISEKRWA